MTNATWFLLVGAVLLLMAFTAARIKRLPLSTAMIYLGAGLVLGPTGLDQFHVNPLEQSAFLEVVTETAVLISLFAAGLKLAPPVGDSRWWVPFRLATASMVTTVGLVALLGMTLLGLPLGAAVVLGAILAPTDPVLATDIQIKTPQDNDRLRFALTGEAGLNDGTAFPMVMLGLGLMGLHEVGDAFSRWWLADVLWATVCGLAVGGVLGIVAGRAAHLLTRRGFHSEYMEDWLGLGLIAVSYGLTLLLHGYGFLAVFAAGFLFHRTEMRLTCVGVSAGQRTVSVTPVTLKFVEQLERLGEVALLLLIGGMLFADSWRVEYVLMGVVLLVVVRPLSVFAGLAGSGEPFVRQAIVAWFGVRGIGSLYYLMYAVQHGIAEETAVRLVSVVLVVVALSVVVHGITVTPLMRLYGARGRSAAEG